MPHYHNNTLEQIKQIEAAMQKAEVWTKEVPSWIKNYQLDQIPDIWQWLQFIYLPLRLQGTISEPHYIAPILSPYLNDEKKYRHILQLVIELDSISPTLEIK